ncbi:fibroblast growth factor 19-like [Scleropages formosus]|uniref:fibroblast growth factor 19-like n=1 Tax=Scleropages formosus TaxID=113540 RepID=UPI000878BD20|nr:fibroblast growth factor 19-like [Scleropages formosus]
MSPGVTLVIATITVLNTLFRVIVLSAPVPVSGSQYSTGWGLSVRLRHLYASRTGLHVRISADGRVDGSAVQSSDSLVEIRPVDIGFVVIKGVTSSCYLCMDTNGKLYGSLIYMKGECSFVERILPNGYNIYISEKHGKAISLHGGSMQRPHTQERGLNSGSLFLPMVSTLPVEPENIHWMDPEEFDKRDQDPQSTLEVDSMDPFGKFSWTSINSPSFD